MRGFLHQLATRSLGLAPQIKSRAALPYAAPAADFSMAEAASNEIPPASSAVERPGYEPPRNVRGSERATDSALPAPIVAVNPPPATRGEAQTSMQRAGQPPRISAQLLPDVTPEPKPIIQTPPPAIIASPVPTEQKPIPRQLAPAPENRHPADNVQPALADLESLVTRLLGDKQSHPDKAPESFTPPAVVTPRQAGQRPAESTTIRPQPGRERLSAAPEADSAPDVHITIGRLEVNPPSRPAPAAQPPRPRGPAPLSLSDYLARRNGGRS